MLELFATMASPMQLLAIGSAAVPVAALAGLVGYFELRSRLRRLPLAVERETLEQELAMLRSRREELQREIVALEGRRGELEAIRVEAETWQERIRQLEAQWQDLESKRREVADVERELARKLEELGVARNEQAGLEAQLATLRDEHRKREVDLAAAQERLQAVQAELDGRRGELIESGRLLERGRAEVAQLAGELARLRAQAEEAEQAAAAARARTEALQTGLEALKAERDRLADELRTLENDRAARGADLQALRLERARLAEEIAQLDEVRQRLAAEQAALEPRVEALKGELGALRKQIERAFENLEVVVKGEKGAAEDDAFAELRPLPACFLRTKSRQTLSEEEALEDLAGHLEARGLHYPQRVLEAFHTCLKIADIAPLTVLAGISGTGKSALPREYADGLGIDFLMVPVQPRWDGPQDLLGYYNYVEGRFKATELTRALIRFDRDDWHDVLQKDGFDFGGRMLLVLLDEMNLARVEYYFSDFLSLLEIRRDSPERARVAIDLGHGESRFLRLTDNVLFVGTMNEDESTQSLSDKVLDRANVIRFARPRRLQATPPAGSSEPRPRLTRAVWESWRAGSDPLPEGEELERRIDQLNTILEQLGRPFGHRLFQAVCRYYANHPATRRAERDALAIALGDQLDLRILPRLRGLETDRHQQALAELERFLQSLEDAALGRAFERAREAEFFFWPGAVREAGDRRG